ncbi:hypothetical protein K2173_011803 [Erythroxylum novogranatense]|uniref:Uncharacterized protein n=1 Tax=Erythroxylum novogranatense TaxID=1862640 RepID=A0AAV8SLW5_9ROSI|nr:hypothetical protein K2173_011803 [Erythroxylum novogranatense]
MGTRIPSHQLKSSLYVSGRPEQPKFEKQPTIASRAIPYTGGDVKKSGELGKMFDIPVVDQQYSSIPPVPKQPSRHSSSSQHTSRSVRSGPNSGSIKKSSGPMPLQPTGLITSGPLGSGPLSSGHRRSSGQLEHTGSGSLSGSVSGSSKALYGWGLGFRVVMWVLTVVVAMGLLIGFLMVAVKKAVILVAVGGILVPLILGLVWNCVWGRRGLLQFVRRHPDAELREAIDGQYIKVTGVVTCGSIALESSYQRVPRCVFVSTELYEYRGCGGKSAHQSTASSRGKYVADFYISDLQSGLRAIVKAGNGAKVAPFVKPATIVDVVKENRDLSPDFFAGYLIENFPVMTNNVPQRRVYQRRQHCECDGCCSATTMFS